MTADDVLQTYEGLYGKSLSSAENPTLEPSITLIDKPVAKLWPFLYIRDGRQPPSWIFEIQKLHRAIIRSADPENPGLEPNMGGSDAPFARYSPLNYTVTLKLRFWVSGTIR